MLEGLWSPLFVGHNPLTLRWRILFLGTADSRTMGSAIFSLLLLSLTSLLTLLFSSVGVTSLSGVFSFDNAFIRLLSSRQYNSARYSENRFPAICLTSSKTWPHWHDLLDLGTVSRRDISVRQCLPAGGKAVILHQLHVSGTLKWHQLRFWEEPRSQFIWENSGKVEYERLLRRECKKRKERRALNFHQLTCLSFTYTCMPGILPPWLYPLVKRIVSSSFWLRFSQNQF